MSIKNNKSLGQHWLKGREVLARIADYAKITKNDTVLEIGPGLGTLTSELLRRAKNVIAVEYDENLAQKLPKQFPGTNLEVICSDILNFDLSSLPKNYIVVANIPYYITSKIIKMLMIAKNKPSRTVLLIQKEVAERLAADVGDKSILALSANIYAEIELGEVIKADLFIPPPKVDSQVVILETRDRCLINDSDTDLFFKVIKAGFSAKRKMLKSSLSGGLRLEKSKVEEMLKKANINPDSRAESLAVSDWQNFIEILKANN